MAVDLKKIFLSTLLTVILMLPYSGSFLHLFEDHQHKTCEISETHLHEVELDCDVLDYQFAPSIQISLEIDSGLAQISEHKKFLSFYQGYSFSIDSIETLRGPPAG
ncbi:MAG: hypothetical protein VW127_02225 [Flavobacteriaceae bacterium]|jgi:hypothetical protein